MKSPGRRKLAIGLSFQRDGNGDVCGQGTVVLQRRNAYQMIGLRRPNRGGERRIRFS
ncbi:MAG: hypothetical protein ACFCUX_10015 [Candidatus Methylacidiphilales bacterium]